MGPRPSLCKPVLQRHGPFFSVTDGDCVVTAKENTVHCSMSPVLALLLKGSDRRRSRLELKQFLWPQRNRPCGCHETICYLWKWNDILSDWFRAKSLYFSVFELNYSLRHFPAVISPRTTCCVGFTLNYFWVFFLLIVFCPSVCPWMWDNLTCWQAARVGEVVMVNCTELFHDIMSPEDGKQHQNVFIIILICWSLDEVKKQVVASCPPVFN